MKRRKRKNKRLIFLLVLAVGVTLFFYFNPWRQAPFLHLGPPPKGFHSHGIDVSHYQGKINWDKLYSSLDSIPFFVYCKATEGEKLVDSRWHENRSYLLQHKKEHGAYHFYRARLSSELQTRHFLSNYSPQDTDLPVAVDVEEQNIEYAKEFRDLSLCLEMIENASGKRPIIYTSLHLYRDQLKKLFPDHKFWIAAYNHHASDFSDDQIIHWQYSDHGKVPGIKKAVDLNYSKIKF